MSNWFLAAAKDSRIASVLADAYLEVLTSDAFLERNKKYFKSWRGSPEYLFFHQTFQRLTQSHPTVKKLATEMPFQDVYHYIEAGMSKFMRKPTAELYHRLFDGSLFKLTWTIPESEIEKFSFLQYLIARRDGCLESMPSYPFAHLHTSRGFRTTILPSSWYNSPERIGLWCGVFESEADMRLISQRYPRWHIHNYPSVDKNYTSQLLIPYGASRMFIRSQKGKDAQFSDLREFAFKDDISQLEKKIDFIQGAISGRGGEKSSERLAFEKGLLEKYDTTEKSLKEEQAKNKQLLERIDKLERQIARMNESVQSIIDDMRPGRRLKRHLQKRYKKIKALFCKKQ